MKCPRDGAELSKVTVGGVEIDKCHHCDGLWFDPGELDKVRDMELNDIEEQLESRFGNPDVAPGEVEGYMRCPRCDGGRLQQVTYTYQRQIKIDRCENCLGVWIDDGELDAIVGEKRQLDDTLSQNHLRAFLRAVRRIMSK
jgi:Zn-finger nucleic acid-binding protein